MSVNKFYKLTSNKFIIIYFLYLSKNTKNMIFSEYDTNLKKALWYVCQYEENNKKAFDMFAKT